MYSDHPGGHHFHSDGVKVALKIEESCWAGMRLLTETVAERSDALVVRQSRMRPVGSSSVAKRFAKPSLLRQVGLFGQR